MWRADVRCYHRLVYVSVLAVVFLIVMLSGPEENVPSTTDPPQMRTIIAYSLESQIEMEKRSPVVCVFLEPPGPVLLSNRYWQMASSAMYLYSAYYDDRLEPNHYVRVLGMREGGNGATVFCQLWYKDGGTVIEAIEKEIWVKEWDPSAPNSVFRPVMITCPVPTNKQFPNSVSVTEDKCGRATNLFKLNLESVPERQQLAVCVKGLDLLNDYSIRLAEWIELNLLFGANKILVYKYQIHPNISKVLSHYSNQGVVEVIPLTIPGRQQSKDIWQKRRNEIIPYNDCLYRSLKKFDFILPVDVDEVIVPVEFSTWHPILQTFPPLLDRYSSFSVRNAYFFDEFPIDENPPPFLHTMRHTIRSANLSKEEDSVKSFVSTKNALMVFNHFAISSLYPGSDRNFVLKPELVRMNHYKAKCAPELVQDCSANFLFFRKHDDLIVRFRKDLEPKLIKVLKLLRLI